MQIIADLQNYLDRVGPAHRHKEGIQLLQKSAFEIQRLYQIADAAYEFADCDAVDPDKKAHLDSLTKHFFATIT